MERAKCLPALCGTRSFPGCWRRSCPDSTTSLSADLSGISPQSSYRRRCTASNGEKGDELFRQAREGLPLPYRVQPTSQ